MTTKTSTQRHSCRKCGRGLTDPRSIARGYGPKCFARMRAVAATHKPEALRKALELIADGGMVSVHGGRAFIVVSSSGTDTYRTAPTGCTCTAGRFGRTCYHQVAAKLIVA